MTAQSTDPVDTTALQGGSPRRLSLLQFTALVVGLLALVLFATVQPATALVLIPATALGALALAVAWRWPLVPLGLMLAFIPLYDGIVRHVTHVVGWPAAWLQGLSLWKEGGLVLLFAILLIQHWTGRRRIVWRLYAFDLWLAALLLLSLLYIAIAARPGIGIYGLRNYLVPLAFFFLARLMATSHRDLKWLLALLLAVGVGVAAFGIYQARTLDFAAMIALGYVDETGNVPFAFRTALRDGFPIPRAVSTTTGPNQFAVYLSFLIMVCLFGMVYGRKTAQRVVLGGLTALYVATAGVVASGFATRVVRGLTGRDPSADAHHSSMAYSLEFMAENPLGIGMGMVGERALQFAAEANVEHTESTVFQIGMELGVFGMILLLIALLSLVLTLWRMRGRMVARNDTWGRAVMELAMVLWIGAMADFVFTPLLQNLLAAGYLWWIAGVAFNQDAYADGETGRQGDRVIGNHPGGTR